MTWQLQKLIKIIAYHVNIKIMCIDNEQWKTDDLMMKNFSSLTFKGNIINIYINDDAYFCAKIASLLDMKISAAKFKMLYRRNVLCSQPKPRQMCWKNPVNAKTSYLLEISLKSFKCILFNCRFLFKLTSILRKQFQY